MGQKQKHIPVILASPSRRETEAETHTWHLGEPLTAWDRSTNTYRSSWPAPHGVGQKHKHIPVILASPSWRGTEAETHTGHPGQPLMAWDRSRNTYRSSWRAPHGVGQKQKHIPVILASPSRRGTEAETHTCHLGEPLTAWDRSRNTYRSSWRAPHGVGQKHKHIPVILASPSRRGTETETHTWHLGEPLTAWDRSRNTYLSSWRAPHGVGQKQKHIPVILASPSRRGTEAETHTCHLGEPLTAWDRSTNTYRSSWRAPHGVGQKHKHIPVILASPSRRGTEAQTP